MTDTVKYILKQPEFIEGIGHIHPIEMQHYDEFMNIANVICLSYDHFDIEEVKKQYEMDEVFLLDLMIIFILQTGVHEEVINNVSRIFSFILKKQISFNRETLSFQTEDGNEINRENYDRFREIVMKQNLLFTPKVYKNKRLQEWADKVLKARAKNGIDSTIEDMISTIAVVSSKDYESISRYSIYQVRQEFSRIMKMESYRTALALKCAGAEKIELDHYAEKLNMFKNPYDDIFKEKSSMKNLNSAVQGD